jgi:membrane glycosyltransferase
MSPVVLGLILAIPVASLTSQSRVGRGLRRLGLLLTPEERTVPPVLTRANALAAEGPAVDGSDPLALLARDERLRSVHFAMLGAPAPRRKGDVDVQLAVARSKIDDADDRKEAIGLLDKKEVFAVLAHADALERLFAKPGAR